jgi:hypothetical protein
VRTDGSKWELVGGLGKWWENLSVRRRIRELKKEYRAGGKAREVQ